MGSVKTSRRICCGTERSGSGARRWTYKQLKRWRDTVELEELIVKTRTKKIGAEHPLTLITMIHLQHMYTILHKPNKAKDFKNQMSAIREQVLQAEHPQKLLDCVKKPGIYICHETNE